ncbi:MAG: formimidoylglutamase [Flavobacteriales bacterium]
MDISVFFKPLAKDQFADEDSHPSALANHITFFTGDLQEIIGKRAAIIGVKEDRLGGKNTGCAQGPDAIRQKFYSLFMFDEKIDLIDLGNIESGNEISDTHYALNQTCQYLLRKNILPIIIGGTQDLTYANYQAYEHLEQTVNLVTIDYRLDFGRSDEEAHSKSYLNKIILHKPNYLFNYSNIGHQRYLTEPELVDLMTSMYFDTWRLGEMQPYLHRTEPILRNADIISIDVASIRQGEAPGCAYAGPNGFYGDQAAQLCRYAGMSDKLSSIGFYEYNPICDKNGQTAHLVAQMLWCLIEGMTHRKLDYPIGDYSEYYKYIVPITDQGSEIVFYKSNKSDRWWMDVPYPSGQELKYERHHLVPCTYEEYQLATNDEMPDRWWKTYQKLV